MGTLGDGQQQVYESQSLEAEFRVDGASIATPVGCRDLPDGVLEVRYPLEKGGEKKISFADDRISVSIRHPDAFTELIPILASPAEQLKIGPDEVSLLGTTRQLNVRWTGAKACRIEPQRFQTGRKSVRVVCIDSEDALTYTVDFAASSK